MYKLYQIDVFTNKKFYGNPAGVVSNAQGLTDEQMQKIAREMNCSETAFILAETQSEREFKVKFFTPLKEVKMCGHATIAANYVRFLEKNLTGSFIQETLSGNVEVNVHKDEDLEIGFWQKEIDLGPKLDENNELFTIFDSKKISAAQICSSSSVKKILLHVSDINELQKIEFSKNRLADFHNRLGILGSFLYSIVAADKIEARFFAPNIGIDEDPVNGSSCGPLAACLVANKMINGNKIEIHQGKALGRDGVVKVKIENLSDRLVAYVSGNVVKVFSTEIEI